MKNMPMVIINRNHYATIMRFNHNRMLIGKRYALEPSKKIKTNELVLRLRDYFPGLVFSHPNNAGKPILDLDIEKFFIQEQGKWVLDVGAMASCSIEHFACLLPADVSHWDEEKAICRYGSPDIIVFFIDEENAKFITEFSKKYRHEHFDENFPGISKKFFKDLDYKGKAVWEEWDFSKVVRHNPPGIYKAFRYYAHRYYTLLCFAHNDSSMPGKYEIKYLNEIVERKLKEHYPALKEKVPETREITLKLDPETGEPTPQSKRLISKKTIFLEVMQEALESVPGGCSIYAPTEPDTFIEKFSFRIPDLDRKEYLEKIDPLGNNPDPFTEADKKSVNALFAKFAIDKDDADSNEEWGNLKDMGKFRVKIRFLYRQTGKPSVRKHYSQKELETIHELYHKQNKELSLDMKRFNREDDNEYDGHEQISEDDLIIKTDISQDDRIQWNSFFEDEFKNRFSCNENRESFMAYFPHQSKDCFNYDSDGNLVMKKYSMEKLFEYFCFIEKIPQDKPLWKQFMAMMKNVMDNINQYRRGK